MSASSDFEHTVKICEFYADPYEDFVVDYENNLIVMGDYTINPLMEHGVLNEHLITCSDGSSHLVWDLDAFLQREFAWKELL